MRLALLIVLLFASSAARADPVTTFIAAAAAWAGVTTAAVYLVAATVLLSAGLAVYGSAQARRAERDARDQRNAGMQDRMVTRIATETPERTIYGVAKVGVNIVAMFSSGDKDQFKHIVGVFAAHECDGVEEVYVNNVAVGLLDENGDVTTGRFARNPDSAVTEEEHVGPSLTLAYRPISGTVEAYRGAGREMYSVPVLGVSGKDVTVEGSGPVTITYVRFFARGFNGDVPDTEATTSPSVRVRVHLGTPADAADAYLMETLPSKWPSTATLSGLAYIVVTLDLNNPEFQGGQVPIHVLARGKKLYDPRTGLRAWSQNPALAIYDYLTSPMCGVAAEDLPVAQFITAANVCDETSGGGFTAKRYTINGDVMADQDQSGVLEAMAQCMAGGIVPTSWDIYAGKYVAPVLALNQSDIIGELSVMPGVSDASIYNGVKGQFISEENDYVLTDFAPYQNAVYREADGRDRYTDIPLPFTDSLQRVHNLARIFTEDMRNGFTIKAAFNLKAWPLKIGQRITFTSPFLGQSAKVYRVTDKNYAPNSPVELTLKEDDASIWDFADAVTVDSTPNTDLPDPWAIEPLASLTCTSGVATLLRQADGSIVPRILVTWPAVTNSNVFDHGEIEIEWMAFGSGGVWNKTKASGSDTQAYLSPITPGFIYAVTGRTVNPYLNTRSGQIATTYQVQVFSARPVAYKWAASQPVTPAGDGSYVWSTGAYGAAPAGWSLTQPAAPGGGGVSLWEVGVSIADISVGGSTPFDWSKGEVVALGYSPAPGNSNYTWVKYGTSSAGAGLTDDPTNMAYIGFAYNKTTATESTNAADYAWSKLTGSDGVTIKGDPGVDGTTYYTWVKYSDNADGTGLYDTPTSTTLYLGLAVNKTSATESIIKTDYVWSKFKGDQGVPGTNNAIAYAYQRSASAPTGSPGAVTYDFATNTITAATLANGWQKTIPAANGNPLYVTAASASAAGTTDTIATVEWSGAVVLAQDGTTGAPGLNSATVTIYQRSATATAPALPSASATYTFATGALAGLNNGWSQYIPSAGGAYLHTSLATAAATTTTDSIAAGEWAAVTLMYDAAALIAAQAAADAANAKADAIVADGVLDRGEKVGLITDLSEDAAKYTQLTAQATALGVSSSAYTAARDARAAYLLSLDDAGQPAWDDITQNTTIVRATYRTKFTDYQREEMALLNAILAKAAFAPSAVIGGRNLYPDSGFERGTHPCTNRVGVFSFATTSALTLPMAGSKCFIFDTSGGGYSYIRIGGPKAQVVAGRSYMLSFYYKTSGASSATSYFADSAGGFHPMEMTSVNATSVWTRHVQAWLCPSGVTEIEGMFGISSSGYAWLAVDGIQVEEGNAATQWSPAPEDHSLASQGFVGDLDASKGAPAGTNVAGVPAETVVGNAASGASVAVSFNNPPVVGAIADVYASVYKPVVTVATISQTASSGTGPYRFDWVMTMLEQGDAVVSFVVSTANGQTNDRLVVKGICQISGGTQTVWKVNCTATDSKGRTSTTQFLVTVTG